MDPVLALALLSLGTFIGIFACGAFYVIVIRPRLLEPEAPEPVISGEIVTSEKEALLDGLKPQIDKLNEREQQLSLTTGQIQSQIADLGSQIGKLDQHNQQLSAAAGQIQTQLADLNNQIMKFGERELPVGVSADPLTGQAQITEISGQLAAQVSDIEKVLQEQTLQLKRQLSTVASDVDAIKRRELIPPARLTDIKGIGAKYSGLLHDAGIHSFEQLAEMTPDELNNLIDVPSWRRIKAESWIEQAKLFSSQRKKAGE